MMHDMVVHQMGSNGWLGMTLALVIWSGLLALVVFVVLRVVISTQPGNPVEPSSDPALTLLCERFARGEISETEYRQAHQVLNTTGQP